MEISLRPQFHPPCFRLQKLIHRPIPRRTHLPVPFPRRGRLEDTSKGLAALLPPPSRLLIFGLKRPSGSRMRNNRQPRGSGLDSVRRGHLFDSPRITSRERLRKAFQRGSSSPYPPPGGGGAQTLTLAKETGLLGDRSRNALDRSFSGSRVSRRDKQSWGRLGLLRFI